MHTSSENALILKGAWSLASAIAAGHNEQLAQMESLETQKLSEAVNNIVKKANSRMKNPENLLSLTTYSTSHWVKPKTHSPQVSAAGSGHRKPQILA